MNNGQLLPLTKEELLHQLHDSFKDSPLMGETIVSVGAIPQEPYGRYYVVFENGIVGLLKPFKTKAQTVMEEQIFPNPVK